MQKNPQFIKTLKTELADWRLWSDRFVVLLFAILAGLTVVIFTWLSEHALQTFFSFQTRYNWLPLIVTPALTVGIVWLTRSFVPGAAGSGIPQVMAALSPQTPKEQRSLFVSLKLSVSKVLLTTGGLFAGLSLGREGPSVQIASGVMYSARRWLSRGSQVRDSGLLLAGGAAGIAAAFNTPLGGVMFAIEELSRHPEDRRSGLLLSAIILAGLISVSAYGNSTYFGVIHVERISWALLVPGLLVAGASGLAGGLFSRLLIYSIDGTSRGSIQDFRRRSPYKFAALCGLVIAVLGVMTGGDTFGSGYAHTRGLLENQEGSSHLYVLWKALATWLTTWAGVPAGIFAPSLAIGGALGNEISTVMQYANAPTLIALGMAGFLAAVTQAPLTAFIIVMEMVDGHELVLSLMASSLIASGVSRLVTRPLYSALAQMQLRRLPRDARSNDAAEQRTADQGSADQGSADQGSADQGSADQGSADQGSADQGSADQGSADQRSADQRSADQASTDQPDTTHADRVVAAGGPAVPGDAGTPENAAGTGEAGAGSGSDAIRSTNDAPSNPTAKGSGPTG